MPEPTAPLQGPLIEAVGASVQRTNARAIAVEDVTWQIAAGEYWIVGGRHGAGKSSFLATMAGLRPPGAGVVRHFGQDLAAISEAEAIPLRKKIGFVFKGGGRMFSDLTVAENIALPLRYHHDWQEDQAAEAVKALLEVTELTDMADETTQFLTTGWQQRVGLARALALQPEVLFLDEPMSGLEFGHRQWWRAFLDELFKGAPCMNGRKLTLIAATSDFSLWTGSSGPSRRFAVLKDKHLQTFGACEKVPELN